MKRVRLKFLGGAETVTGSRIYLETEDFKWLVDCGLFQGLKELRLLNREPLEIDPKTLDAVLLTHGHLDHVGYLPKLVKDGFNGVIYGTAPTLSIAKIILKDSAEIQEEEAARARAEGYSKHKEPEPLYTLKDAEKVFPLFKSVPIDIWTKLSDTVRFRFKYNGHIIGSAYVDMDIGEKRWVFSGDVGRPRDYLLFPPDKPKTADYLILESTYGHKLHPDEEVTPVLRTLIQEVIQRRSTLIIPSFAVERLQSITWLLWHLYKTGKIPNIPVYVDSPMGSNVFEVFANYPQWHGLSIKEYRQMLDHMVMVGPYNETWEAIDDPRPKVVVAGSGMLSGGRVLTYLTQLMENPDTRILLIGYQAEGTRGRMLLEGAHELKIFGKYYAVHAKVSHLESLSAHADQSELLGWTSELQMKPERVFLNHGEQTALQALRVKLETTRKWRVTIPRLHEEFDLL